MPPSFLPCCSTITEFHMGLHEQRLRVTVRQIVLGDRWHYPASLSPLPPSTLPVTQCTISRLSAAAQLPVVVESDSCSAEAPGTVQIPNVPLLCLH